MIGIAPTSQRVANLDVNVYVDKPPPFTHRHPSMCQAHMQNPHFCTRVMPKGDVNTSPGQIKPAHPARLPAPRGTLPSWTIMAPTPFQTGSEGAHGSERAGVHRPTPRPAAWSPPPRPPRCDAVAAGANPARGRG